ncbi:MAG: type II toxin-antitoxin system VapC family toxin [Armatimonadetes bacterium]|nr:type II toxin-antitoxin system VapC family toxin [Armatimonadota bacterium]
MYLLDTDVLSNLLDKKRQNPQLRARFEREPPGNIRISPITVEELLRGALNRIRKAQTEKRSEVAAYVLFIELFADLGRFKILPFTEAAERVYRALPASAKQVGTNDCRIAAIACVNNCIVVTLNADHYQRIDDQLSCEDWSAIK